MSRLALVRAARRGLALLRGARRDVALLRAAVLSIRRCMVAL
jgi:hypothetical protein